MKSFSKILISVWLVYHLATIILMPNGASIVGRKYQYLFLNYANIISLNTTWNFFSPDPAHTMYLEYVVFFENEMGEEVKEPVRGYYPEGKNQGTIHPAKRRNMYLMRYVMLDPKKLDYFILPWLCRHYEGATRVQGRMIIERIPILDQAILKNSPSLETTQKMQYYEKSCPELLQEQSENLKERSQEIEEPSGEEP